MQFESLLLRSSVTVRVQVLLMLLFVFLMVAALSSVFLSLTVALACAASVPPRTMAFTLLAIGAEAPDCIVNFIASK